VALALVETFRYSHVQPPSLARRQAGTLYLLAALLFPSRKGIARNFFEERAQEALATYSDAAGYGRCLGEAEVNARNIYLASRNPAWDDVSPEVDAETGNQIFGVHDEALLTDRREYYEQLRHLNNRFPVRAQFWLEKFALRPSTVTTISSRIPGEAAAQDSPTPDQIAKRRAALKAYRDKNGIDAEALAKQLNVDPSAVRGVVRGDFSRGGRGLEDKILKLTGITPETWYA